MSYESPKIMILGKSKTGKLEMQDILKDINASQIPMSVLEGVYFILNNEQELGVQRKDMPTDIFNYDSLHKLVDSLNTEKKDLQIVCVKIIIDLDEANELLQEETNRILGPIFAETT